MGHLLEILFDILGLILPWPDRKKSSTGESRMDKSARWFACLFYVLLALGIVGGIAWYSSR